MSFRFTVTPAVPPTVETISAGLNYDDLVCENDDLTEGPWPEGNLLLLRDGVSTRGVEVVWDGATFSVMAFSLASPEDWELMLKLLVIVGGSGEAIVTPEEGDPCSVSDLVTRFGIDWQLERLQSDIETLRAIASDSDTVATIPGPVREVFVGQALIEELTEMGEPEDFADLLLDRIRAVQYIDEERYFVASKMVPGETSDDEEPAFTMATIGPDVGYFIPDVDYIALVDNAETPAIIIPAADLFELLDPEILQTLDETQYLLEPIDPAEWPAVVEKAKQFAVDPFTPDS